MEDIFQSCNELRRVKFDLPLPYGIGKAYIPPNFISFACSMLTVVGILGVRFAMKDEGEGEVHMNEILRNAINSRRVSTIAHLASKHSIT
jgi:hypothetical protein